MNKYSLNNLRKNNVSHRSQDSPGIRPNKFKPNFDNKAQTEFRDVTCPNVASRLKLPGQMSSLGQGRGWGRKVMNMFA
jgi:hypothetical protein